MTDELVHTPALPSTTSDETVAAPKRRRWAQSPAPPYLFWMLVVFLLLEYVRPPVIVQFKLQMLITLLIPIIFLSAAQRPWTRVLSIQLGMFVWCAKSIPIAYNWFAAYFTTRTLYGNISIAIALTWVCSNLQSFRRILWIYVAVMVYQAVWAMGHGGTGTGGFLQDENDLALACITAVPTAFLGLARLRGTGRWLAGGALALLVVGVVVSFSRGGFVGLVAALGYCWWISRYKVRTLLATCAAALLVPLVAPPQYLDEIRSISDTNEGTARGRRFLWEASFRMWLAHPILGVGGGNGSYLLGHYQPSHFEEREYQERDWSGTTAHSLYFQLLPEQGAVGMILFGMLIWTHFGTTRRILRNARRPGRAPPRVRRDAMLYAHALNGGLFGFLVAGAFVSVGYYPYVWYFTALSGALEVAIRRELMRPARPVQRARPHGGG